jgi:ribosomal protein S18 acetylase RimI-like enzyme
VNARAPRLADVPALTAFLSRVAAEDGLGPEGEADVRQWLTSSSHDVEGNFRIFERDGEIAAYVDIGDHGGLWIDLRVPRAARGGPDEEEAFSWAVSRARELGGVVRAFTSDGRTARTFARHGFAYVRSSFRMEIELQGAPEVDVPAGIELRPPREGEERALWATQNETFSDTWEYRPETFEAWREDRIEHESYDPSLWVVADAGGEVAGVALNRFREGAGWVGILGVRRSWRRRGVGMAVLHESFRRFWERGERRVRLGVDAESPTGALSLYERAGMTVQHRSDAYEWTPS